jgi:hypothetical protein
MAWSAGSSGPSCDSDPPEEENESVEALPWELSSTTLGKTVN